MVRFLAIYFFYIFGLQASVDVDVSPKESSGNPVTLRFVLRNEDDPEIENVPRDTVDWVLQGPQQVKSSQFSYSNGQTTQDSSTTISFLLFPKKNGQLKVPLIQIKVKGRVYGTPPMSIRVTRLGENNSAQALKKKTPPGFPIFPLDEDPSEAPLLNTPDPANQGQRRLEVAVVAEPSKVEVYPGELIMLPFYIYTNENIFRNLEFASFPTFKDFLKEELYLPRNWKTERVQYHGSNFFRAEVIRFALFPLKEGELLIDPLKMRFEVDTDLFQLFQKMLNDDQTDSQKSSQSFLRSSGSLPIKVKPLPPKPANVTQEEIPVGQYSIKAIPPKSAIVQNEAFTLKLRIEGRGNVKGIPEPDISIPPSLQKSKTETDYTFNTVAEGYKDFDLLLVPRTAGTISIPENTWTYFDPEQKKYESLKIPSMEFKVTPSNRKGPAKDPEKEKASLYAGEQDFEKESDPAISLWLWSFPILIYALAGFLFIQRRNHEKEESLLSTQPWLVAERKIYAQKDLSSADALGLVEEWILKRFQVLNIQEAAFDDLAEVLRKKATGGLEAKIEKLRSRFQQIESARFAGQRKNSLNLSFEEIKKLSEEIIHSSLASSAALAADDLDEDS